MSSPLIALDDGHGMSTPGKRTPYIPEIGRFIHENEFNREVVKYLDMELRRCGFRTLLTSPTDYDAPLHDRVEKANNAKADVFVSIHYNAFDGEFNSNDPEGLSVHVCPGSDRSMRLANCILKYLKGGTNQDNRGIKQNNFYVLTHTTMAAILSENGFMDSKREALLMLVPEFQKEVAREHAQGLCEYFGMEYIPEGTPATPGSASDSQVGEGQYRVKSGDTLWSISRQYYMSVSELKSINPSITGDLITVGQILSVNKHQAPKAESKPVPKPVEPKPIRPYPGYALRRGMKDRELGGNNISAIQRAVGVAPDGSFGPITENAVKSYQRRHNLEVDGLVGPITWNTIF